MVRASPLDVPRPTYITDDILMFEDAVDRFIDRECVDQIEHWSELGEVPRSTWKKAGDAGFLMASAPVEYGGSGGTILHDAIIAERLARAGAHELMVSVQNMVFGPYICSLATEEQKKAWIPKLASGEWLGAIAMSEPSTGSDLQAIRTHARRDGSDYVINGQKIFTTLGHFADIIMLAAKTDSSENSAGISLFCVPVSEVKGLTRGRKLDKIGLNAAGTAELFFEDMRIPHDYLLGGAEGLGFKQMMINLEEERLVVAIEAMGMIERALAETILYVSERRAFGKRVLEFQNTQFKLAEMKTEATIARVFVDHCLGLLLDRKLDATTAAMAKYWLSELQGRIVDQCLQLFGGYGYINEYPIARMYRDARVSRIYGGTTEIMKLIIGRSIK